jgi:predicted methyltransferase
LAPVNPIRVTERAQGLAGEVIRAGDIAVDATAGKGRDTAFLAQTVGPSGHVHAFDIQADALQSTRSLLDLAGLTERTTLHHRSHAELSATLPAAHRGRLAAVIFNLGYLPGGNPAVITQPTTTAQALRAAYDELRPGGRVVCVAYTGHPGGPEESDVVLAFAQEQESLGRSVERIGYYPNPGKPWILVVEKPAA